jgi:hypothetical protein
VPEADNVNIIKNVVNVLISISGRKTDHGHALMMMDALIKQLEPQFNFLKNIHIQEKLYSESSETFSIMSDINVVKPTDIARAIHALVVGLHDSLGDSAGHFFFKEIKQMFGDEYVSRMQEMGVNFTLMQLDDEFTHMKRVRTQQKYNL